MRVPYSWLREVVAAGAPEFDPGAADLERALIGLGHEVEDVVTIAPAEGPLTVGRVTAIEELTEFKKPIRACRVDVGEEQDREIICGATNFAISDLVVVALPGTTLPGGFTITSRRTYGRVSDGMICSSAELGLSAEAAGILVLPPGTAAPGAAAVSALELADVVFDLTITPDRGYALSLRGLAREVACAYDLEFVDPAGVAPLPADGEAWPLTVDPETGVRRFVLRAVTGVDATAVSPWWLQRRLLLCGIRAIAPAVDVTNYVMLELGHPMHAHDRDRVKGGLQVRFAREGETVTTLDDVTRRLDPADVLIVDDAATAAIGGVMGAGATEMRADSTAVLLEAAVWDPAAVSRTQRRLHLSSESSRRYERSVDPAISVAAVDRAAGLLTEIAGGAVGAGLTDWTGEPPRTRWEPPALTIDAELPDRVAGVAYPPGATRRRLEQVGATVSPAADGALKITPPSWRPDLLQPADLVEEVMRLEGYDAIPSVLPAAPAGRGLSGAQRRRRAVGKALALDGYVEVLPTVFLPAGVFDVWGLAADDPRRRTTRVLNPLESDRPELATTVLPALLEALTRNVARGTTDVALFALTQVVQPPASHPPMPVLPVDRRPSPGELAALDEALPDQPLHVAAVLCGLREPRGPWGRGRPVSAADAFEAVALIAATAGVEVGLRAAHRLPWHPGRCAEVLVGDTVVGHAGQLHPGVIERSGLPAGTCALEVNLDALPLTESRPAPAVSPFPAVFQDVALVVDRETPAAAVADAIRAGAGPLLESVNLFDVYTGTQVGEQNKSLAFALRFRAPDRTLTEDEASAARDAAVHRAGEQCGARLRD
ncbi:phenylalanine--tRNA ligase subunit beta [Mycolicibacillus koreensis]|nr:phenylalanine--tRNA ligase subunit beta [Mycolicibacillus koreensis]